MKAFRKMLQFFNTMFYFLLNWSRSSQNTVAQCLASLQKVRESFSFWLIFKWLQNWAKIRIRIWNVFVRLKSSSHNKCKGNLIGFHSSSALPKNGRWLSRWRVMIEIALSLSVLLASAAAAASPELPRRRWPVISSTMHLSPNPSQTPQIPERGEKWRAGTHGRFCPPLQRPLHSDTYRDKTAAGFTSLGFLQYKIKLSNDIKGIDGPKSATKNECRLKLEWYCGILLTKREICEAVNSTDRLLVFNEILTLSISHESTNIVVCFNYLA